MPAFLLACMSARPLARAVWTRNTVGKSKAGVLAERVALINPACDVVVREVPTYVLTYVLIATS